MLGKTKSYFDTIFKHHLVGNGGFEDDMVCYSRLLFCFDRVLIFQLVSFRDWKVDFVTF